ncbi:DUF2236 domain-containing protein [Leucobacter coleopterorum]|uniref:DUF2236 domain-containing protein n=2 Tax=Leucobacter coleopterorum TaxID=2714933 RepID=A0ABX6JXD7_9MICO|nr:oxygenase MpaB family protein [Leucobacter coleopterorum]QIM18973.1 DUF2236 domain-containing protein [Leucobacter coleopterorum]
MSQVLERMVSPMRTRLIETLSGHSKQLPTWLVRLEDGEDEGLFGENSAAWVVHSSMPTLVAGVRALLLQALHPGALAGVRDHSRYQEDPLGRLAGTIQWIHTVTFGSTSQAIAGTRMVQAMHERVRGEYTDGRGVTRSYSANDPELARWVHIAFTDAFLTAHEHWGRSIPGGADGYVAEWAKAAELMNVSDPPRSAAALRAAIDDATDKGELRGGPEVSEIVRFIRRPPLSRALRASYRVVFCAAVSTLQPRHREMLGLSQRDRLPIHTATKLVLSGAEYLIGPRSAAELAARRRLVRLQEAWQ